MSAIKLARQWFAAPQLSSLATSSMSIFRIGDPRKIATYGFVMAARGAYVLFRLITVLGVPYVLGPAALGQFGTFSGLVAVLPTLVGLGVPQHIIRRLAGSHHRPSFSVLVLHSIIGFVTASLACVVWIGIYPDVDLLTGLLVAFVAGVEVIRATVYSLAIARSSIIRANAAYVLSGSGPSLVILAGFVLFKDQISLATLMGAWLVTNIASTAVAMTVARPDLAGYLTRARDLPAWRRRYGIAVFVSRDIYLNQIVDVARVYCDRLIVPLLVGFYWAGIYNFFALAANVTVMICNATFGQTDLPQLMKASASQSWTEFRQVVRAGLKYNIVLPILMMLPLFFLRPLAAFVMKTTIDAPFYYALTAAATLVAVSGSVADYLWYAVYAAHGESKLARTAIVTVPLGIALVAAGTVFFGLVGALLAVALTSGVVSWLRWRTLEAHVRSKTIK